MTYERVVNHYILTWDVDNIGECRYITGDFEDAELFYKRRVNEGCQPSLYLEETVTNVNRTKIK